MKYYITNYTIIDNVNLSSELMDYERAIEEFNKIENQARRGLRPFPDLVNEDGVIIK